MKKYKHKLTGETVEQKGDYYTADGKSLKKEWVENSCDWEEVIEEKHFQQVGRFNWGGQGKILRVELVGCDWAAREEFKLPKNWYVVVTEENRETVNKWYSETEKLKEGNICGVRRLTMCMGSCYDKMSAESISHRKTSSNVYLKSDFGQEITFEQFKKYVLGGKLITTEDGVDVYKGDAVYWVSLRSLKYLYELRFCKLHLQLDFNTTFKIFSTKEKAEEWVAQNTRCLTFKEATEYSRDTLLSLVTMRNIK